MSDLVFRTEELTNNQIAELYVASDYEQSIIDKLKAPSPVLLIGSRGVGKSFLFKMSEIQMLQEFSEKKILPVFLTFRKASLLKTSNTIGDLISAPEGKLKQAKYIADVRARTIKNAGIAAVCEYLLG